MSSLAMPVTSGLVDLNVISVFLTLSHQSTWQHVMEDISHFITCDGCGVWFLHILAFVTDREQIIIDVSWRWRSNLCNVVMKVKTRKSRFIQKVNSLITILFSYLLSSSANCPSRTVSLVRNHGYRILIVVFSVDLKLNFKFYLKDFDFPTFLVKIWIIDS